MTNLLILVSGFSCTGKTTLARNISQEFSLPLVSRDDIKESLFNTLGWQDREWSKKLGIASYNLLYYFIETLVAQKTSLIIESNFLPRFDNAKFQQLKNKYEFTVLQIHCQTENEVLIERFKRRSESGDRHPGHVDHLNYEEFQKTLYKEEYEVLDLEGKILEIDTTDFTKIDYQTLYNQISYYLYHIQ